MLDDQGEVLAILDWEICTLGRPTGRPRPAARLLGRARGRRPGAARRGPDRTARVRPALRAAGPLRGRSPGVTSPTSPTTVRSGSGSWPASSRGSMCATPEGPRPATDRASTSSPPLWVGWVSGRWPRWSRCDRSRARRRSTSSIPTGTGRPVAPAVDRPDPGGGPGRMGRRRHGRLGRHRRPADVLADRGGGDVRHRAAHRPAGPPPDRPAGGRGDHRADLAGHPGGGRQGPGGRRHPLPDRSRARLPLAHLHRGGGRPGPGPRRPDRRRARGLPRPHPSHPPGATGLDRPPTVSRPGRAGGDGPRHPRGAGRRPGGTGGGTGPTPACRSSASGPGCPTTCRPCRTPRPARR